jgi:transcriptional regulator with XRE-family HTH domain
MTDTVDKVAELLVITAPAGGADDTLEGLSDQEQVVVRMKLAGLSQEAISKVLGLTKGRISQIVKRIREHYESKGRSISQDRVIGESITLYEEVEHKAWEVYHNQDSKKLRALEVIMNAREKQLSLLMDLGIIKRAAQQHEHLHADVSPLLARLTDEKKRQLVSNIIDIPAGEEPEPPDEASLDEIAQYQKLENNDDNEEEEYEEEDPEV